MHKHRGSGDHESLLDIRLTFLVMRTELEILELSQNALEYIKNSEKIQQYGKFQGYKCVHVYAGGGIPLSEHNFLLLQGCRIFGCQMVTFLGLITAYQGP